jgi:4-diphosphocytidyl-2-C-methyl-D-erythritol kinase
LSAAPGAAPAKVNLCLHVTGRRADGYHLLDSLVVFAGVGDEVSAAPADGLSLALEGPEAGALAAEPDNLVLRAARALAAGRDLGAALRLTKRLPVASGIGGGSSDAAAALRVLSRLWGVEADLPALALALGADVPVCLAREPAVMRGIGEALTPAPRLPRFGLLLANPRLAVETRAVFAARGAGFSAPIAYPEAWSDAAAMARDLAAWRNDLEAPAMALCPAIAEVRAAIAAQPGCLLARMSGSGATCFGLFGDAPAAERAAAALPRAWWRWGGAALAAA